MANIARLGRLAAVSTALVAGWAASAEEARREWPSARFRGEGTRLPPCSCRGPGVQAWVGQDVCLRIGDANRLARCEMVGNVTSWVVGPETCDRLSRAPARDPGPRRTGVGRERTADRAA